MNAIDTSTSRRAALAALAGAAAFAGTFGTAAVAVPAVAPAPDEEDGSYEHGLREGGEIALLYIARAWIDRWKACGGDFSGQFDAEGRFVVWYGMAERYVWTPTDRGNPNLPPHAWLLDEGHHDGAVKVLNGLLEMVPGLRETIREIVGMRSLSIAAREA